MRAVGDSPLSQGLERGVYEVHTGTQQAETQGSMQERSPLPTEARFYMVRGWQAQQKLTQARDHFSKAGLLADTLLGLTAGGRRIHAREVRGHHSPSSSHLVGAHAKTPSLTAGGGGRQVMGLMEDESLHYLLEPRLPDEVVIDYLDRKVPTHQATPQR